MIVWSKKIKAFTIGELLVVLVVSSLVIGLSMLILNLVHRQLSVIHKNTNSHTQVQLLEKALWHDFNTHRLFFDSKKRQLLGVSEIDTVTYQLNDHHIIRNRDTLHVPVFNTLSYLDGNVIAQGRIDALELQLSKTSTARKLFIYKTKDASFYLNDTGFNSIEKE